MTFAAFLLLVVDASTSLSAMPRRNPFEDDDDDERPIGDPDDDDDSGDDDDDDEDDEDDEEPMQLVPRHRSLPKRRDGAEWSRSPAPENRDRVMSDRPAR